MKKPFDVYIGRGTRQFPLGSIYGNPFVIGPDGDRDEVLRKHWLWLWGCLDHPAVERPTIADIRNLHGRTLGCWCKTGWHPEVACHGDNYVKIADSFSYLWYCFFHTAHKSWIPRLGPEFHESYMVNLSLMLEAVPVDTLCPLPHQMFRVFRLPFDKVRVVIVGQDPYPTKGDANGIAFAHSGKKLPRSLQNIVTELKTDMKIGDFDPSLVPWLRQGVFPINTSLTTTVGRVGAHSGWGWHDFTEVVVNEISKKGGVVFMLWGEHAKGFRDCIEPGNLILTAAHPSPFSCARFFGCKHFSRTNVHLIQNGQKPIRW